LNDSPKEFHIGEQTTDEMCFCWLHFTAADRTAYTDPTAPWQRFTILSQNKKPEALASTSGLSVSSIAGCVSAAVPA
jgi:hypothetical protein